MMQAHVQTVDGHALRGVRGGAIDAQMRAGALAAFTRALVNLVMPLYIVVYAQVIPGDARYDPTVLKAHKPLLYVEPIIMVAMSLSLILAVWVLFDLMAEQAPNAMRLSLATTIICGGALFLVAGSTIARFDGLFLIEDYTREQQRFALHILDMSSILLGHVMVTAHALSTLLWGYAGWRTGILPRALSGVALLIGTIGLLFEFTPVNLLGFLLQAPLFIWLGLVLWRKASAS